MWKDGLSDGKICSVCGAVIEEQKILPKTGHTPSDWIIDKNLTNTEFGSKHKECTICHKVLEEESIDKLKMIIVTIITIIKTKMITKVIKRS